MRLLDLLLFKDSRKVSFGIYLFIASCVFLFKKLISADDWMVTMALCSALVGGGTLGDAWLKARLPQKQDPPKS